MKSLPVAGKLTATNDNSMMEILRNEILLLIQLLEDDDEKRKRGNENCQLSSTLSKQKVRKGIRVNLPSWVE